MMEWLQHIPAERVLLWVFLAGVAWSRLNAATKSLREHGRRLGGLAARVTRIEAHLNLPPPPLGQPEGSNGE